MEDDVERRFEAAVNVIRSMPKKGAYQPPHETMLKFYGYFKQAKEGPCNNPKPGFWDVIKKAKWEAWNSLGDLPQKEAMESYINELQHVMETMPDTEEMEDFGIVLKSFYETVYEPDGQEPPHILRIFKKKKLKDANITEAPEKWKENGHSEDTAKPHQQSFDESKRFQEQENDNNFLEKVSNDTLEQPSSQPNSFSSDLHAYQHHNPTNGIHEDRESDENNKTLNSSSLHDLKIEHLPSEPFYIVEVSSQKKGCYPDESEEPKKHFNEDVPPLQSGFPKDNSEYDKVTPASDDSEDEEFCDSLDPEHLSRLQNETMTTPQTTKFSTLNTPDSHTSSSDSSTGFSLSDSDESFLKNGGSTTAQKYTSTPSEKKTSHVTFKIGDMQKNGNGNQGEDNKGCEPHIEPDIAQSTEVPSKSHGGIIKSRKAVGGHGGGDPSSRTTRQAPNRGSDQARNHRGINLQNVDGVEDTRMIPGSSASHSDSDSDDTNHNGESCDSCGERDEINERIMVALERLQKDMSRVLGRLETMEDVMALRQERLQSVNRFATSNQGPWWSQFIPSKTVAFLVLWPFVINLIFYYLRKKKARKS